MSIEEGRKNRWCELLAQDVRLAQPPLPPAQTVTVSSLQEKIERTEKRHEKGRQRELQSADAAVGQLTSINVLRDEVQLLREQVLLEQELVADLELEAAFLKRAPARNEKKREVERESLD